MHPVGLTWSLWKQALGLPNLDKRQHGFHLTITQDVECPADIDEVNEASVEVVGRIQIPEWLKPVAMIDVGVAAHHLTVDALDVGLEVLREATRLSKPILASESGKWCVETCGTSRNRRACTGCAWCRKASSRQIVYREKVAIVELAFDPFLDQKNVLAGGNLDGTLLLVKPCVRVAVKY